MSTCVACHKPIYGRYLQALGGDWHPECFLCPDCRQPIGSGQFFEKKGYPFHPSCYARKHAPLCADCESPIVGNSITALGKTYHPQCLRCTGCRMPIRDGSFLPHENKPYHAACYHQRFSPRCAVCQGPVKGSGYITNHWGESYCEEHLRHYQSCSSCNRLMAPTITGGGKIYADGRSVCQICRKSGVDNEFQGSKILRQVRSFLSAQGMPFTDQPIPLRLTGSDELQKLRSSSTGHPPIGITRTQMLSRGGQVVDRVLQEIVILYGLPEEHFAMVAAHELGHAWLFINQYDELPAQVEEGLCNLCSYLWLKNQNTPAAAFRLKGLDEDQDAVYGQGFRSGVAALKRLSFPELLDFIKKQRRWPINNPLARLLRVI